MCIIVYIIHPFFIPSLQQTGKYQPARCKRYRDNAQKVMSLNLISDSPRNKEINRPNSRPEKFFIIALPAIQSTALYLHKRRQKKHRVRDRKAYRGTLSVVVGLVDEKRKKALTKRRENLLEGGG